MKQRKISKINRNRKPEKVIVRRHRRRIQLCDLEIQLSEVNEDSITCTVQVAEVGFQRKVNRKIDLKRDPVYKIVSTQSKSEWKIAPIKISPATLEGLINSKIYITNGKRVVGGVVIKAEIVGGGATNPPVEGGLPPVDE